MRVTLWLLLGSSLLACSVPVSEPIGASRAAIVGGRDSDASQDAVVFLTHVDAATGRTGMCTGTLVAPNLVLTARHCVSDADEGADCAADGTATRGGAIRGDHDPATLRVYTGRSRPPFKTQKIPPPAGVGARIVHDGAKNLCGHDLALVVLATAVPGATVAKLRLDRGVVAGESVTAVGWGITTTSTTPPVRQERAGVGVVAVGPDTSLEMPVPAGQFAVRESICLGDSGGPALAESGAVVGVVSGGGNGALSTPDDPSAPCVGDKALNLYTELAPFADTIAAGFDAAGATIVADPAPAPPPPSDPAPSSPPPAASGCSAASGPTPEPWLAILGVLYFFAASRTSKAKAQLSMPRA